jgi:guanylate kinase
MKHNFEGRIYVLVGPSASGKTSLIEAMTEGVYTSASGQRIEIPKEYSYYRNTLKRIVTVTTRKPRPGEINGVHYKYIKKEEFEEEKRRGNILAETIYAGNSYGILKEEIDEILSSGYNGIVVLDKSGAEKLKRKYSKEKVVDIFIYRDLDEIFTVLKKRPNAEEDFFTRFELAKEELKIMAQCDYVIFNVLSIEDSISELCKIIEDAMKKGKSQSS